MSVQRTVMIVLAAALAGCATSDRNSIEMPGGWAPTVETVQAEVQLVGGESTVVIKSDSECDAHPTELGCLEFKTGTIGIIQFILDGGVARSCEGQPDNTWVWKDIQLTAMSDVDIGGGTKRVGTISRTARHDFGADSKGGVSAATIRGQYMSIRNLNTAEYDIWYTLYAQQCGDAANTATSDPRVKNHGNIGSS